MFQRLRNVWSGILSSALEAVVSRPSDIEACTKLFMLPKCILLLPPYRLRCRGHDLLTLIKERIRCWRDGDYLSLWFSAMDRSSHFSVSSSSSTQSKARKAHRAVEAGHFHKALQALNFNGLTLPSRMPFLPNILNLLPLPSPLLFLLLLPSFLPPHPIRKPSPVILMVKTRKRFALLQPGVRFDEIHAHSTCPAGLQPTKYQQQNIPAAVH